MKKKKFYLNNSMKVIEREEKDNDINLMMGIIIGAVIEEKEKKMKNLSRRDKENCVKDESKK